VVASGRGRDLSRKGGQGGDLVLKAERASAHLRARRINGALSQLRVLENMCVDDDWLDSQRALFNHVIAFLAGIPATGG
jgi:hypothetical protein